MIDRDVFEAVMGAFAERLGKPLGETASVMYYATLSEELDTETFQRAARAVFKNHRYNTWPAVADFLDAVRGGAAPAPADDRFAAQASADVILREATWPNGRTWEQVANDIERYAGTPARAAFYAVGGPARFRDLLEADVNWLRRELVQVYPSAAAYVQRVGANDPTLRDLPPGISRMVTELARLKELASSPKAKALLEAASETAGG